MCLFRLSVRVFNVINKHPVPTKRVTIILIKVKSCKPLLRVPPVCIIVYLKLVTRYRLLIFDNYHPDSLHLRQEGCVNPRLIFEEQKEPTIKEFWETQIYTLSSKMGWPHCWSRDFGGGQ